MNCRVFWSIWFGWLAMVGATFVVSRDGLAVVAAIFGGAVALIAFGLSLGSAESVNDRDDDSCRVNTLGVDARA